jgi:hypothetical protein
MNDWIVFSFAGSVNCRTTRVLAKAVGNIQYFFRFLNANYIVFGQADLEMEQSPRRLLNAWDAPNALRPGCAFGDSLSMVFGRSRSTKPWSATAGYRHLLITYH